MSQSNEVIRSLPAVTTLAVILFFSLAGNSLICIAFSRNRRLRTITNFYVLALAVTDIIASLFVHSFKTIASSLGNWPFGFNFCQFNGFLAFTWSFVLMNLLALTAVNRYFCIVKPHLYPTLFTKKKTVLSIMFVCVLTLAVNLTTTFLVPILFRWHSCYLFCQAVSSNIPARKVLTSTLFTIVFSLPMCVILFCYGSVYRAIRRHNSAVIPSLQDANGQGTVSAHEIQASRVLLAAVIAFIVCWFPAEVANVLERVAELDVPSFWQSFSSLAAGCSSWINPIIYGITNRAMRKEFLKLLRCRQEN